MLTNIIAEGRSWVWPANDSKCRAVVFDEYVSLRTAYRFLRNRRTAIQAGGNMGAFPWKLAQTFERVITAEPDPVCFKCLDVNVIDANVVKLHAAFSDVAGSVSIQRPDAANFGSQYVSAGGDIPAVTIDSLGVDDCDLIYLDVEGAELKALTGAVDTIEASKPLICVEDKGLSTRFGTSKGDIGKWLETMFGYKRVGSSKRDVMYACA